jgi:MFS family permease
MIEKREDLGNAIALNSSMVNVARLAGPSIAGILIAVAGEGVCFLMNALSYCAVIASLLAMNIAPRVMNNSHNHVLYELREGFRYVFNFGSIKAILLLLSLVSLMGVPYQVLMPVFARDIFHGGPRILGFLMGMAGGGALAGALYLAGKKNAAGLERLIPLAAAIFGVGIVMFSFSRVLWFSLAMIFVSGFAMMVQMASSNTVLQTIVEEDKRGRVMSFYTMSFMGMVPFGSLLAGSAASTVGAPHTLSLGGIVCIIGAGVFTIARRKECLSGAHGS